MEWLLSQPEYLIKLPLAGGGGRPKTEGVNLAKNFFQARRKKIHTQARPRLLYSILEDVIDQIRVPDRVSWKRERDGVRTFGHVQSIHSGFFIVVSDQGVRYAIRRRDITKECR